MKLPRLNLKYFAIWLAICAAGGGLISWFSSMPFWGGASIVAAALIINGIIAKVEDNAPGGFNNPHDKSK
ncbi:hypothetical protein V8J88_21345 [Massilia sp. W12]|uniref:hypothetical protein n=1 Tax=Massilia sp. W12 TaxID=3126507 RepID=UPI0030CC0BE3